MVRIAMDEGSFHYSYSENPIGGIIRALQQMSENLPALRTDLDSFASAKLQSTGYYHPRSHRTGKEREIFNDRFLYFFP
jgi:hypothetical protein